MKIYALTILGKKLGKSVTNPNTPAYDAIYFLSEHGVATLEQIARHCGLNEREALEVMARLKRNRPPVVVSSGS